MRDRRLSKDLVRAAAETQATALDCVVTLGARVPMFAGYLVAPTGAALVELNRAYTEKVAATWEGAWAAGAAWQAAMLGSAFRIPTAAGIARDCLTIAREGAKPARKRVRANAKRLGRPTTR